MPLYVYFCEKCNIKFEKLQSYNADPTLKCEKCENECKRVMGRSSFVLKGGCWASDGYTGKPKDAPEIGDGPLFCGPIYSDRNAEKN